MNVSLEYFEAFYQTGLGRYVRSSLYDVFDVEDNKKTLWLGYAKEYMPDDKNNFWGEGYSKTDKHNDDKSKNRFFSYHEKTLPFYYQDIEKINVIHALEHTDSPDNFLKEIYRILKPESEIILVVPNRSGVWAWGDKNPFGQGQPYSKSQIKQLLENNNFQVKETKSCLFLPPTQFNFLLKSSKWIDKIGRYLWPQFCGVFVVKARKRIYAPTALQSDIEEFAVQPFPV